MSEEAKYLTSTTEPGESFGRFNLPMNMKEMIFQLSSGTPCEIPRFWLPRAMEGIQLYLSNADIEVNACIKIAQLTPHRAELSDHGRKLLAS